MSNKYRIITALFILGLTYTNLTSAADAWSICKNDEVFIQFSQAPRGFICLSKSGAQYLEDYLIPNYQQRLSQGEDINLILGEIEAHIDVPTDWTNEYSVENMIASERIESAAKYKCQNEKRTPEITIWKELFENNSIQASCSFPQDKRNPVTFLDISLSWKDTEENSRSVMGSGGSFSGVTIDAPIAGKYAVSCNYRPSFCRTAHDFTKEKNVTSVPPPYIPQQSIARRWNEVMLNAIRKDRVRPPVQARNLFHLSAALYDIWTQAHHENAPYLFWNWKPKSCTLPEKIKNTQFSSEQLNEAMSYAAYRIIESRYKESPGFIQTLQEAQQLMNRLGYSWKKTEFRLTNTPIIDPAVFWNAVARCYLAYGKTDGANEEGTTEILGEFGSYSNKYYKPVNPPLDPENFGNPDLVDWNRWQPITLETFIDQGWNPIRGWAATFIGAEWGGVKPFSLTPKQDTKHVRDGNTYHAYLDPGMFPEATGATAELYKWNFLLVGLWSSHLDPKDTTMMDISPATLWNAQELPADFSGMMQYYDLKQGWAKTYGRKINPKTGEPYKSNLVRRGDYTRVIAEMWADGPTSETPPGHWFKIFNEVSDKIEQKRFEWQGPVLGNLEWDIKGYFLLGWAMHDAAIAAWWIKWAYDGIRPISAIRAMAAKGQSSDPNQPSYNPQWLPLVPGYVEIIWKNDPLAGKNGIYVGKIKMRAWKWPKHIYDPAIDTAGSDWILAEKWWPYQRPSFVTPPFAGYISGHSTFSRAAAEMLTRLTGDEYFPGGLFEFSAKAHNYLVFEQGPASDVTLQWATYRDAANESALSRIWWGIHPPMDDITGRKIGEKIGNQAFEYGKKYFHIR